MNLFDRLLAAVAPAAAPLHAAVPGYAFGDPALARAPYTLEDLASLKKVLLFGDDDTAALRQSAPILADQTDAILDTWYGFVGATPELLAAFVDRSTGQPDVAYLDAVRKRFALWIGDTARAEHDQAWLDWQHEIGLRHHRAKKNRTDGADAAPLVQLRYLVALTIPVTTTLRPFLAAKGAPAADVDRMHAAWIKAVLLQAILWCHPYVHDGEF